MAKIVEKMNLTHNVVIVDDKKLNKVIKKNILNSKIGRALNKFDNKKEIPVEKRRKIMKNAMSNGYFYLNGFADVYRDMIKISYVTLYRRVYSNKDILKTLVALGYIENPYKNLSEDNKFDFKEHQKNWKIKVKYDKRHEFIKFIKEKFLTSEQRRS